MALSVSKGDGSWAAAVNVSVSDGTRWVQAKSVKRSDGAGGWETVWAPQGSIAITGPSWALTSASGTSDANPPTITPATFTITLSHVESIIGVALEASFDGGKTWGRIHEWSPPLEPTITYSHTFATAGSWLVRGVAGHLDGRLITTIPHAIRTYTKNLTATASNPTPVIFEWFTLTASCAPECTPAPVAQEWLYRTSGLPWMTYKTGLHENPQEVYQAIVEPYAWTLRETYEDGSVIYSDAAYVTATELLHFHEVVPIGGDIQVSLDRAREYFEIYHTAPVFFDIENTMACVELAAGEVYDLGTSFLLQRRGVRLVGNTATITTRAHTYAFQGDDNGGGGYGSRDSDWQIINTFIDCQSLAGGVSSAHVERYRLNDVTIKNVGGGMHHVHINSSGGPAGPDFNVQVLDCNFIQDAKAMEARTDDEAIQLDYAWAGAAPNVGDDGTVTNNVLVERCVFNQVPRAIGGHTYDLVKMAGFNSHIEIRNNAFANVNPAVWGTGPESPTVEGAVRSYYWSNVVITGNIFDVCTQPIMVYVPAGSLGAQDELGLTTISRNLIRNCGDPGRHGIYGNSESDVAIGQVLCTENRVAGGWLSGSVDGPDGYFIGFSQTDGLVPGETVGVVIRDNIFAPDNYDVAGQADYVKYQRENFSNITGVLIENNTLSDGTVDNT